MTFRKLSSLTILVFLGFGCKACHPTPDPSPTPHPYDASYDGPRDACQEAQERLDTLKCGMAANSKGTPYSEVCRFSASPKVNSPFNTDCVKNAKSCEEAEKCH